MVDLAAASVSADSEIHINQQCPSPLRPASPADSPIASPEPTITRIAPLGCEDDGCDDDPLDSPRPNRQGPIARYTPVKARPSVDTKMDLEGIDFYFKSPPLTPLRSSVGRIARQRHLSDEGLTYVFQDGMARSPSMESTGSSGSARGKVRLACALALLWTLCMPWKCVKNLIIVVRQGAMPPYVTESFHTGGSG